MKDSAENIAKVFLEIKKEGCIQFDDLLIKIQCNPKSKDGVKFKLQSIKKAFVGMTDGGKTALHHCKDLYNYMRDCLEQWRANMADYRR